MVVCKDSDPVRDGPVQMFAAKEHSYLPPPTLCIRVFGNQNQKELPERPDAAHTAPNTKTHSPSEKKISPFEPSGVVPESPQVLTPKR